MFSGLFELCKWFDPMHQLNASTSIPQPNLLVDPTDHSKKDDGVEVKIDTKRANITCDKSRKRVRFNDNE